MNPGMIFNLLNTYVLFTPGDWVKEGPRNTSHFSQKDHPFNPLSEDGRIQSELTYPCRLLLYKLSSAHLRKSVFIGIEWAIFEILKAIVGCLLIPSAQAEVSSARNEITQNPGFLLSAGSTSPSSNHF
ncbi:hypothetical protein NPIL_328361 [Nephila pilipes]|uniref:Uncharacterized protein n=1 Tax=Nephila pilipes TaxID=299642 RepID=A0A8X6NWW3_NEPPI|nr:hypothetical protein NPIL_328361 [Nephila pilipes]